jgi:predicted PurR-regulated permease PerM
VKSRVPFYILLALLSILALVMIRAVLVPAVLAVILAYLLFPVYDALARFVASGAARAGLLVTLVLLAILLPTIAVLPQAAAEFPAAIKSLDLAGMAQRLNGWLDTRVGHHVPLTDRLPALAGEIQDSLVHWTPGILGAVGNTAFALFVMVYTLFYVLQEGRAMWRRFLDLLPLDESVKPVMTTDLKQTLSGVLYGQLMTSVMLGVVAGGFYLVFGVSHVLLWTVLTALFAIIPILGPVVIWLVVGAWQLLQGHMFAGIGILVGCGVAAFVIDNVVKPRLVAGRSELHPLTALLGVIGGLEFFGLIGFILGPLVISLVMALLRVHQSLLEDGA